MIFGQSEFQCAPPRLLQSEGGSHLPSLPPIIPLPLSFSFFFLLSWGISREVPNFVADAARLCPESNVIRQRLIVEFQFGGNHTLRFDKTLTGLDLDKGQQERALLRRLEWAISRLDVKRIHHVLPAVGLNIASCVKGARDTEQVAAFPGRITIVNGKLRHHETPSFGVSNHLAGILIQAHTINDAKTSIVNIKPEIKNDKVDIDELKAICEQLGYAFAQCEKGRIIGSHTKLDVIIDAGGYGWEPSLYILAHNPLELIDRTHQVSAQIGDGLIAA